MAQPNRPRSRQKNVTSGGKGVSRRDANTGSGNVQRAGGGTSPLMIILGIIVMLLGGGGGAMTMLGGGGSSGGNTFVQQQPSVSTGWSQESNVKKLDETVAKGSRDKYTVIKGNGKDITTIMVYICGTDLESNHGMATSDMQEMLAASFDDHINLLIYTGGCQRWKNNAVSNNVNQIYQVKGGKFYCIEKNCGNKTMTNPATLTEFIKYCKKNYPANRNDLILWDHGGGSVTGYGYDQKDQRAGAMNLAGIQKALNDAKMKFDFIGFDACLMATTETALTLSNYADYMIASEETEPGIGWYYTDWLTEYGEDPSMDTLSIGKRICDDFVSKCAQKCPGQKTTLSVTDLAEISNTVPSKLSAWAKDTTSMIKDSEYQKVSTARNKAREFAESQRIDQVDLADFAGNMGTDEGKALAKALKGAVKYNNTASNMTNAYGLSVYFPSKKISTVDRAVQTYNAIDMDDDYTRCIKNFATVQASGQAVASSGNTQTQTYQGGGYTNGGNTSAGNLFGSLIGQSLSGSGSSSGSMEAELINQVLQSLLTSGTSSISTGKMAFAMDNDLDADELAKYIEENQFDASALTWSEDKDGNQVISLEEDQWEQVADLELNMFYDDGDGYIDLGRDNVFEFNKKGDLIGATDNTWLSINGQPVAYYHTGTIEEDDDHYTITGYVPAKLNGTRVNLILVFDDENPNGYIAGAANVYANGETQAVAKPSIALKKGDILDFLCDYYSYNGKLKSSHYLGEQMTVTDEMTISNTEVGDSVIVNYRFVDQYGQEYWTETLK
ncbi:MAG: clostripain-related cysteine peptidase [Lachnospiraceae bacterium]|nr:clostripain-related cysteine peptidase [Lachnospiraceae bacterium]